MAFIRVPTTFNIDLEFEIPEFYRRMIALAIDVLVEFIYLRVAFEIMKSMATSMLYDDDGAYDFAAVGLLFALPIFLYHIVLEITMNGQSVGKKIMGIRVVNENGGRPSLGQFIIRWLLRISDVWIVIVILILVSGSAGESKETAFMVIAVVVFLLTDIVLVVASKKSQRIGDMLARTILIRTTAKADISDTVFQEVESGYVPRYPQIMQLSDRDINAIKNIVETARKRNDPDLAVTAAEKVKHHLRLESDQYPIDFLDTLLKDYNYLSVK
ncbi:MAG: RDD family protein [Chitinophagaceae bacterium]|nr:MAG: RDD family protein [Chitinophagaceae bacterium]